MRTFPTALSALGLAALVASAAHAQMPMGGDKSMDKSMDKPKMEKC